MNTAIYARVSAQKQAQEKTIESQINEIKNFAKNKGYKISDDFIFSDDGYSGSILFRPSLERLRDKAVNGEIDKVLILSPDRLARKFSHQLILEEEFKKLNTELVFINRKIAETPEDQLFLQMQGVIAEYEKEKIVERSRRGRIYNAKMGKIKLLPQAPYGYNRIVDNATKDVHFEFNTQEAPYLKYIFENYANENKDIRNIAKALTSLGVPTRKGAKWWSSSTIHSILKNSFYMGKATFFRRESIPSTHKFKNVRLGIWSQKRLNSSYRFRDKSEWATFDVPALISKDIFEKVQKQMEINKNFCRRNTKNKYLLTGLLHCKECGYTLIGKSYNSKKGYKTSYYICLGGIGYYYHDGRKCFSPNTWGPILDDLVWKQVSKLIENPETMFKEYGERIRNQDQNKSKIEEIIKSKNREIKKQKTEKERLIDLCQQGVIDKKDIIDRMKRIKDKMLNLRIEINLMEENEKNEKGKLHLLEQFEEFRNKIKVSLDNINFQDKQKLIRLLVSDIEVDAQMGKITIKHMLPLRPKQRLCPSIM